MSMYRSICSKCGCVVDGRHPQGWMGIYPHSMPWFGSRWWNSTKLCSKCIPGETFKHIMSVVEKKDHGTWNYMRKYKCSVCGIEVWTKHNIPKKWRTIQDGGENGAEIEVCENCIEKPNITEIVMPILAKGRQQNEEQMKKYKEEEEARTTAWLNEQCGRYTNESIEEAAVWWKPWTW